MAAPFLVTLLDTITLMTPATVGGGPGLFPDSLVHPMPQAGGFEADSAKPLNAAGAAPPLTEFDFAHRAPQNVTVLPGAALPSPITNAPRAGGGGLVSGKGPTATSYAPCPTVTVAGAFGERLPVRGSTSYIDSALPAA